MVFILLAIGSTWSWRALAGDYRFTWQEKPDPKRLLVAKADMRRIAASRPEFVKVVNHEVQISIESVKDSPHEAFSFPGMSSVSESEVAGPDNIVKTLSEPFNEVVAACLLTARAHFSSDELEITTTNDLETWNGGRALYAKVFGRPAPAIASSPIDGETRSIEKAIAEQLQQQLQEQAAPTPVTWSAFSRGGAQRILAPVLLIGMLAFAASRSESAGTSSYYWFWIMGPTAISLLLAHPLILAVVPVALIFRRWLPDPILWMRYASRTRHLEGIANANSSNITARRDLARIRLLQHRPARALPYLEQALARDDESAELLLLYGKCLLATDEHERALAALVQAAQRDPKMSYGEAYLRAADALIALKRWSDAEDALERFIEIQKSSVEAWYKLARVRAAAADTAGAAKALLKAREAYEGTPGFHKRLYFGWYVRARLRSLGSLGDANVGQQN